MVPHVGPPHVLEIEAEAADKALLSGAGGQGKLKQVLGVIDAS